MARQQTLAEAAAIYRKSVHTLMRWIKAGAPHDRLGRNLIRVDAEELREWLLQREAARAAAGGAS